MTCVTVSPETEAVARYILLHIVQLKDTMTENEMLAFVASEIQTLVNSGNGVTNG